MDKDLKLFEFDIQIDCDELTEDVSDALFEAGCDDALPAYISGEVWVDFSREAPSLKEAVESAMSQIAAAGYNVINISTHYLGNTRRLGMG